MPIDLSYLDALRKAGIIIEDDSILQAGQMKGMLELHIEQSVVLERKGLQIGVVEAIAGIRQILVTLQGVANHAGATPMSYRYDALQGAARVISAVEEIAKESSSQDTVATVGIIRCFPGQANVIPGKVQFTVDVRNPDPTVLDETVEKIKKIIEKNCRDRNLTYEIDLRSNTPPIHLSGNVASLIERVAKKNKIPFLKMVSGAVHDSSTLADWGVVVLDVPAAAAEPCARAYRLYRERRTSESGRDAPLLPLPDFFIGAHAEIMDWPIATADEGSFRTYFPSAVLMTP